jgi:hypothetical protein
MIAGGKAMKWRLVIAGTLPAYGSAGGLEIKSALSDMGVSGVKGVPLREVAAPLRDAWLRFHEQNLCLGVDSIFVFQPKGVDIWCRIKDEKNYQQLSALVEPLRKSCSIELYSTHVDRELKAYSVQDDEPPPSFWTNAELRTYLQDPFLGRTFGTVDRLEDILSQSESDPEMKRRLKLYSDGMLEDLGKMVRLSTDLPAIAGAAFGADALPDTVKRAREVCSQHAREAGRCAARLADNLSHALPRGDKRATGIKPQKETRLPSPLPTENASLVSRQAQDLERRVMLFLYPEAHTVSLEDLRTPGLVDALRVFQRTVSDFESSARKAR